MKTYVFIGILIILGWNLWAIDRDKKLFDTYDNNQSIYRLNRPPSTSLNYFCDNQAGWHPDCSKK